jgi:hypothetical protein
MDLPVRRARRVPHCEDGGRARVLPLEQDSLDAPAAVLAQHPFHNGRRIRKIVVKKCSQSGFTEAVLNCIRWFAKYAPRNVIYAINSAVEAINIRERLVETLKSPALGEEIFTGDEDDIGRLKLTLRHMIVWFFGSFTSGSFANKQAPFCVSDEAEEHAVIAGDTTTVVNLDSRLKDAEEGLHVVLSKPKLEIVKDGKVVGGVICAEHAAGNQEIYLVPCPHCGTWQEIEWSRIIYRHCKNLLGEWDFARVLSETYLECAGTYCDKPITEDRKEAMINHERALVPPMFGWFPTAQGRPDCDPEVISQHMSDLYSLSRSVTWGRIAIKMIKARTHSARQGVYNHNLGLGYKMGAVKTEAIDILKCRAPYKRGEIPFAPVGFLLGADIGKSDAPGSSARSTNRTISPSSIGGTRSIPTASPRLLTPRSIPAAPISRNTRSPRPHSTPSIASKTPTPRA